MGLHKSQIPPINLRTTCRIGLQGEKKTTKKKKKTRKEKQPSQNCGQQTNMIAIEFDCHSIDRILAFCYSITLEERSQ